MYVSNSEESPIRAHQVFAGLVPHHKEPAPRRERSGTSNAVASTASIVLVGSLTALALNLTGPVAPVHAKPIMKQKGYSAELAKSIKGVMSAANAAIRSTAAALRSASADSAPTRYVVESGDTISSIASRFGISTASVLALNGLGWSSLIFPGQELTLGSTNAGFAAETVLQEAGPTVRYTVVAGDTISAIGQKFATRTEALLRANGLTESSLIFPGDVLLVSGGPDSNSAGAVAEFELASSSTPIPAGSDYTIESGDTIGDIALRHSISERALLEANGLTASSLIFSGDRLIIPSSGATPAAPNDGVLSIDDPSMRDNANTIIRVGRELGVGDDGIVVALASAMQESTMRNLSWGDRDSVGLFQQRPSAGWGTPDQLQAPDYAARLFYGGPSNPNAGRTDGLLDIPDWESLPLTDAAQRVQISAFPRAYAAWEPIAWEWLTQLG